MSGKKLRRYWIDAWIPQRLVPETLSHEHGGYVYASSAAEAGIKLGRILKPDAVVRLEAA